MDRFSPEERDLIEAVCANQMEIYLEADLDPGDDSGYGHIEGAETVEGAVSMLERILAEMHGVEEA